MRPERRRTQLRLLAAVVSGVLLALAYPPVDLGPLALVALVPLLWAWRDATPLAAARDGFVFALVFLGILMAGVTKTGYTGTVSLIVAAGIYYAATGALAAALGRGVRAPWLTATVWVFFEGLRGRWPLGGLAWGEIGIALHNVGMARALVSFGGVALVTFAVVAANGIVVDLLVAAWARAPRPLALAALALVGLLAATFVADVTRYQPRDTGRLRFALLQGDAQEGPSSSQQIADQVLTNAHFALADRLHGHYDLIVFPESALDYDPEEYPPLRQRIVDLAARHGAVVLVNARYRAPNGLLYNANLAYGPDGRLLGVYAKQHLVPFGEFVPLRDQLTFISDLRQIPYDFTAGDRRVLFRAGAHQFGTVICYESAYAPLVRDFVRDGAQALVVSTSDRSYGRSGIAATHVATGQMRAAETGRPVLHAALSGVTAVIDADGRVQHTSPLFAKAAVTGTIATTTGETPFVRFGEWVLVGSALTVLAAVFAAWQRQRRGVPVDSMGRADRTEGVPGA